jgi:small conductance mechanosensitive channel
MNQIEHLLSHDVFNPSTGVGALAYGLLFLLLAVVASYFLRVAAHRVLKLSRRHVVDRTSANFIIQLSQIAVFIIALMLYAHLIPKLRALGTALLASVSVVSVILGLAAQNTLGNLIAGISLLLYRPFEVGDRLQVNGPAGPEIGTVEVLNLGYTVIQTYDNRRVVVPNSAIASQVTVNYTTQDTRIMVMIPVGISYSSDIDKAREILLDIARNHPLITEAVNCPVTDLGNSSVNLSLRAWCESPLDAKRVEFDVYETAKKRFDQAGIEIPFPYTNVVLKADAPAGKTDPA